MAQKPDGKSARQERVVFTRPAAERIGRVVRRVEAGDRDSSPLTFGSLVASGKTLLRLGTFTGAWSINTAKTVTFRNQTTTPNTTTAHNIFADITGVTVTSTVKTCAIAKEGTAWYLIAAQC